jgi:hypothetical protein
MNLLLDRQISLRYQKQNFATIPALTRPIRNQKIATAARIVTKEIIRAEQSIAQVSRKSVTPV